jgi:superfamily I DNA and/or RNA helicase
MSLASGACSKMEQTSIGTTIGVFLSEHRRSVPEVIGYCNKLAYSGRLKPLRAEIEGRKIPAMGFKHIQGRDEKVGSSRKNQIEAQEIAAWIEKNKKKIESFYGGKKLDEVLGVITPFYTQARVLEGLLAKKYPHMTIGTVGALQGAEREIIIFSSVYDKNFRGQYFFDRSIHLLNVAVSRAKDSFLVFGDMRIFDAKASTPSGELARWLFKKREQEIK